MKTAQPLIGLHKGQIVTLDAWNLDSHGVPVLAKLLVHDISFSCRYGASYLREYEAKAKWL